MRDFERLIVEVGSDWVMPFLLFRCREIPSSQCYAQLLEHEILKNFRPHRDRSRTDLADGDFGLIPALLVAGQVEKFVSFPCERIHRISNASRIDTFE